MQRVQFHQSRLVESAIPSSSNYQHTLDRAAEFFVSQSSSLITAQQQAVGWIGQTILNQSVLISYTDVFGGRSIFALLMMPLAPAVRNVKQTTETVGHGTRPEEPQIPAIGPIIATAIAANVTNPSIFAMAESSPPGLG